jgi:cyclomaltodextrinase
LHLVRERRRDPRARAATRLLCALWLTCACREPRLPTQHAITTRPEQLQIVPADADVFAFEMEVQVVPVGEAEKLASCVLARGDTRVTLRAGARAMLPLRAGANLVSAQCATQAGRTLRASDVRYTVLVPETPVVAAHLSVEQGVLRLRGQARAAHPAGPAPVAFEWFLVDHAHPPDGWAVLGQAPEISLPTPSRAGDHSYALRVRDAAGGVATAFSTLRVGDGEPREKRAGESPDWLPSSVVYGVIPPLFGTPGLDGVTAALDDLRDLGVNALWLSPIFATTPDDYGYAVTDSFQVRPAYGGSEALERLVKEAHRRDMRILLDLVPNHTSAQHPYFEQAQALGPRSHYFGFYARDARGRPTHYFDWEHLPNLNYDNPEVVTLGLLAAEHWLRETKVDGYRIDAAWGIQRRRPGFWSEFTRRMQQARPEVFLLAEASARDSAYIQAGFDAVYDWSEELGHHAWEHVFDGEHGIARRLHAAVTATSATPADRIFRFLNNNDTGARFISKHGEPLTRVATAALLTLPGVPCLYAFDEVGAEYEPYEELAPVSRRNAALRAFHRRLIDVRRHDTALHGTRLEVLHVGEHDEAYVYVRREEQGEREVLVALNFSREPSVVSLRPAPSSSLLSRPLRELFSDGTLASRRGVLELRLEPWAVQVWRLDPSVEPTRGGRQRRASGTPAAQLGGGHD